MSDKPPTKRGILSSLMGLFGDDAQKEAEENRAESATPETNGTSPAPTPDSTPFSIPDSTPASSLSSTPAPSLSSSPSEAQDEPGGADMGANVVRESYEPGWYAVSTARTSRPAFVSDDWSPPPPATDPPAERDAAGKSFFGTQAYAPEQPEAQPTEEQSWSEPVVETPPWSAAAVETPVEHPAWSEPAVETPPWSAAAVETPVEHPAWSDPAVDVPVDEPWSAPEPAADTPAKEQPWSEPTSEVPSDEPWRQPSWAPEPSVDRQAWSEPAAEVQADGATWSEPAAAIPVQEQPWSETQESTWSEPVAEIPVQEQSWSETVEEAPSDEPNVTKPWGGFDSPAEAQPWSEPAVEVPAEAQPWSEPAVEVPAEAQPWSEPAVEVSAVEPWTPEAEAVPAADVIHEAQEEVVETPVEDAVGEAQAEAETFDEAFVAPVVDETVVDEPSADEFVVGQPASDEVHMEVADEPQEPVDDPEPEAGDEVAQADEPVETESETQMEDEPSAEVADGTDAFEPVEVTMPAPEPELATMPAAPASEENGGLQSRVAADRRRALEEIVARGVTDDDVPAVAGLLQDPERGIRLDALMALESRADSVDASVIRQALRDPSDEVRAAAVRLAAARMGRDVTEVFAMVAERQWPGSQQAALDSIPRSIATFGIGDEDLEVMLTAVAAMDSDPNGSERGAFAVLAIAVGPDRLRAALETSGDGRLGAARLLHQDGSPETLRALAEYAHDPDPEVTRLARAAAEQLGPDAEEQAEDEQAADQPAESVEQSVHAFEAELGPQGELVSGLARALGDPDEAVRDRAAEALRDIDHGTLINWALGAMGSNDPAQVELGAQVAESAGLSETAGELLARGAAEATEARGPFARALASFNLSSEALVDLVNQMDSQHKPEGVRMMWGVGGRSLLPAVQPLLDDSSAAVRVAALEVFGEAGDAQTIEIAQHVLERDSSPVVRATAISVIGRAGLDQRAASLAQALADPDPDVRATAVEVLPAGMGRQAAELLLEALADQDERVWQAAIRHLSSVPDRDRSIVWQAIERCPADRREHLVATLERTSAERLALLALDHLPSPDAAERTLAITLAGRAGTPECVRGIVQALQDPAPTVRRTAASALLTLRSGESIAGLTRALSDPDVEVRVEAVRALSVIDDDNVLDPLITALKDPEMRVRDVAGEALVRWRSPAVARRLAIALTNPSLRRPAGEVLARMGNSAVDPLVDILMEDDSELAGTVGHLLESLVGPDVFLTRLGSMDPSERLRAVEALGAIRGERGVDGLVRALSDPVESIRVRAVGLLGEIGDERAFEAVKQAFLGDPVLEVVTAAEETLKRLQSGSDPASAR
jgi:HEAT repeat protein